MSEKSVLIVSASAGTGHLRAGHAMLSAVHRHRAGRRAGPVDVLAHAPRLGQGACTVAGGPDTDRARWANTSSDLAA